MAEPTLEELKESIEALTAYRDRLHKEVSTIAKKLRMPQHKIDSTLKEHSELKEVEQAIIQLTSQHSKQS